MPMIPLKNEWDAYWNEVHLTQKKYQSRDQCFQALEIFVGMRSKDVEQDKPRTKKLRTLLAPYAQSALPGAISILIETLASKTNTPTIDDYTTLKKSLEKTEIESQKISYLSKFLATHNTKYSALNSDSYSRITKLISYYQASIELRAIITDPKKDSLEKILPSTPIFHNTTPDYDIYTQIPAASNLELRTGVQFPTKIQDAKKCKAQDKVLAHKEIDSKGPLILNLANGRHSGGAPFEACAQEEDICQDTTAMLGMVKYLPNKLGKWPDNGNEQDFGLSRLGYTYLVENCTLCENDDFDQNPKFDMLVAAAPSFNRRIPTNNSTTNTEYKQYMAMTIRLMLDQALEAGNPPRRLILGALGCGAFANNPWLVAALFRTILSEDKYKDIPIEFAIYETDELILNKIFNGVFETTRDNIEIILNNAYCYRETNYLSLPIDQYIANIKKPETKTSQTTVKRQKSESIIKTDIEPEKSVPQKKSINWLMIGLTIITGFIPVFIFLSFRALLKNQNIMTSFQETFYLTPSSNISTKKTAPPGLPPQSALTQPALVLSTLPTQNDNQENQSNNPNPTKVIRTTP